MYRSLGAVEPGRIQEVGDDASKKVAVSSSPPAASSALSNLPKWALPAAAIVAVLVIAKMRK